MWEEEGRKFKVERRENGLGRYILCSVIDVESKRFCQEVGLVLLRNFRI